MHEALDIYCGEKALKKIHKNGFHFNDVKVMVGASGGAKWLSLSRLDQVLFPEILKNRKDPLFCLGSSIGTWRFACAAQKNPAAAFRKFEETYINYVYSKPITTKSILLDSYDILEKTIGDDGLEQALNHDIIRTSIMAVKSKGLLKFEDRFLLPIGLLAAALSNVVSRKLLGLYMKRALFSDSRNLPPFYDMRGFPIEKFCLAKNNFKDAILASSSIPMFMDGIKNIKGATSGVYRDGGFIDYHFDLSFLGEEDGLVLYPHFFNKITPGWFDKHISWHGPSPKNYENTIVICPSTEFVRKLPGGKIPDRSDFKNYSENERISNWKRVTSETDRMADDFMSIVDKSEWAKRAKPLFR